MAWFDNAIIYQIYPRSFMDTNSDGVGDIRGVIEKLDYIKSLGVDAIWLSPIFESPMKDFGYDISDYKSIDPVFGSMEDLKTLVRLSHEKGLRVMLDMVLNHSSDQHEWFKQSCEGKSPYSDFYIWKDKVPNNWLALFGGKAWTYNETRGHYYLHSFLSEQPDLNWHNEECRKAIFDQISFYLEMGIDGFRFDVINLIGKDPQFRNNPYHIGSTPRPYDMQNHIYDRNTEYTHKYIRLMRDHIKTYGDKALLGEIQIQGHGQMEKAASYLGKNEKELDLCFDFSLVNQALNAKNIANVTKRWYELCSKKDGNVPCWVLSNHDFPRAITRAHNNAFMARLLLMWLLLQRGASVLYMGEEVGMHSPLLPKKEIQDPVGKRYWPFHKGRDAERRPMAWDSSTYNGFSTVEPWLSCDRTSSWQERTVRAQETDKDSLLNLTRRLCYFKKSRKEIAASDAIVLPVSSKDVLSYYFEEGGKRTLVVLNMGAKRREVEVPSSVLSGLTVALTSFESEVEVKEDKIKLLPYLGVVLTN